MTTPETASVRVEFTVVKEPSRPWPRPVAFREWNPLSGRVRQISIKTAGRDNLIPLYFEREVFKKYYDQPSKHTFADGILRGAGWCIRYRQMDTGHIRVLLKDLALGPPEPEQHHWRQYNVALKPTYLSMAEHFIPLNRYEPEELVEEFWSNLDATNGAWARSLSEN